MMTDSNRKQAITDAAIRHYLGHNGVECRVRIRRDGTILRHGSPNVFDRSKDYWAPLTYDKDEIAREMSQQQSEF